MVEPTNVFESADGSAVPGWRTGAHMSAAGGIRKAFERLLDMGGDCLQVFSASPRIWNGARDPRIFDIAIPEACIGIPVFIHAAYLVNLIAETPEIREKSAESLIGDLRFNEAVSGCGVIVHPGSSRDPDRAAVLSRLTEMISGILGKAPPGSRFIVENSAGQAGKVGSDLADIAFILSELRDVRLGWCLDTCHAFASGYRFTASPYPEAVKSDRGCIGEEIERLGLWASLRCIHVNDSRDPFGSGRDRHENIGRGRIPLGELSAFLRLPGCREIPLILEVPGMDGKGPDRENLGLLRSLIR